MGGFSPLGRVLASLAVFAVFSAHQLPSQVPKGGDSGAPDVLSVHEMAQRVDRHYNHLHSLKAAFTESYAGMGVDRNEGGTLLLEKPGRMRWDYSSPHALFLLDGKYAWYYKDGNPQVQRIEAKKLNDLRTPLRYLLGHAQLEKEMNRLTLSAAPNGEYTLTGEPKGQDSGVSRLKLTVTREGSITGIEIEETDGAVTRFTFADEQANVPIATKEFQFIPPAGVPVVDSPPPV